VRDRVVAAVDFGFSCFNFKIRASGLLNVLMPE